MGERGVFVRRDLTDPIIAALLVPPVIPIAETCPLAPTLGFDPSLLIVQSALETVFGRNKWWEFRLNPSGKCINDKPSTHTNSGDVPTGTIAAQPQLAHMHAEVYGARKAQPKELQGDGITCELVLKSGWGGTHTR